MTTQLQEQIDQLEKRVKQLKKKVAKLEQERDEARESFVISRMVQLEKREQMRKWRGKTILAEHYVAVRMGRMSLEDAVAARDRRFPIFDPKLGLTESYEAAL